MDGSKPYPDNLIITRTTMNNIPEEFRGKIRIFNKIDVFDQIVKDEGTHRMKQGKVVPITSTNMKMYKWEDTNRTEQRQQMENSLFEMYNIGKKSKMKSVATDKNVKTRSKSGSSMTSTIGVTFLETLDNEKNPILTTPQDPHIDYLWEHVTNISKDDFIPTIGFTPIENSCVMINI